MDYNHTANKIRKKVLKMIYDSGASHLGSCFSLIDILVVLYFKILHIDPKSPFSENRDRLILSKGHAVAALYAVLAEKGFFSAEILDTFYKSGGKLPGHSTRNSVPGIEVSTGSLGHGLSMGAGMALAGKRDKKDHRVFALMSDGELDEGSSWEAILFAGHHKLNNLIAIIDYNKLQATGRTNEVLNLEPLAEKWRAFGWHAQEINGHNFVELEKALTSLSENKPNVIIAHTIKGQGVSFIENKVLWHYRTPDKEEFEKALAELGKKL